jgi:hypothetical protein
MVALIHDELISSWLGRHGRPDFASNGWSEQTYAAYLAQIHAWAEVGCDAETAERFIFQDEDDMRGNLWSK